MGFPQVLADGRHCPLEPGSTKAPDGRIILYYKVGKRQPMAYEVYGLGITESVERTEGLVPEISEEDP